MASECIVKVCLSEKNRGDELFCEECRERWRRYCERWGIVIPTYKEALVVYLDEFTNINYGKRKLE